jgi:hypothetical protein
MFVMILYCGLTAFDHKNIQASCQINDRPSTLKKYLIRGGFCSLSVYFVANPEEINSKMQKCYLVNSGSVDSTGNPGNTWNNLDPCLGQAMLS